MIPALPIINEFVGTPEEVSEFQIAINRNDFQQSTTFRQQIGIICMHLHNDFINVSYSRIGALFGKNKDCVRNQHDRYKFGKNKDGRPFKLTNFEMNAIVQRILEYHTNPGFPIYPGYDDIEEFIIQRFNKTVKSDTIRHLINRNFRQLFKNVIGKPMELKRMEANIYEIDENLNQLAQKIEGVHFQFVINIDEIGNQDFSDAELKTLIVPANYPMQYAPYSVDRSVKRSSCIAAISPGGIVTIPQIAVVRETVDSEVYQYISSDSVSVVHTPKGFVNTDSFKYWFENQFLPGLRCLRQRFNYFGRAVIIMDGLKAHDNILNEIDISNENIIFHFLVAHASDQQQPLDLVLFGLMKRYEQNFQKIPGISQQSNQIIKIHNCYYKAATPFICKSSFQAAGIVSKYQIIEGNIHEVAHFELTECKKVRHYQQSYINELIINGIPLTENQKIINLHYIQQVAPKKSVRIPIKYFSNKQ